MHILIPPDMLYNASLYLKAQKGIKPEARFKILTHEISVPITETLTYSVSFMREYLEQILGFSLPEESIEKYSCGCYFAQRIFLSPQRPNLSDLSEIFSMCIKDKACAPMILRSKKNTLEHVKGILAEVGLEKEFEAMEILYKLQNHISKISKIYSVDEKIYGRFLNGLLIYEPNDGRKARVMRIGDLASPLEGTFDLSYCRNTIQNCLSISIGYRKIENPINKKKIEMWICPRFLVEKEINGSASYLKDIFPEKWPITADVGIFWNWGKSGWQDYDYLTHQNFDQLSRGNMNEKWKDVGVSYMSLSLAGSYVGGVVLTPLFGVGLLLLGDTIVDSTLLGIVSNDMKSFKLIF